MTKEENKLRFKVVDKRRYTESGKLRKDLSETEESEKKRPLSKDHKGKFKEKPKSKMKKTTTINGYLENQESESANLKVDFASFIVSLATQALALMGEVEHPDFEHVPINLDAARQTIDMIGIIEEKTRGNLTPQEDQLLKEVLSSLRMAYVAKQGD